MDLLLKRLICGEGGRCFWVSGQLIIKHFKVGTLPHSIREFEEAKAPSLLVEWGFKKEKEKKINWGSCEDGLFRLNSPLEGWEAIEEFVDGCEGGKLRYTIKAEGKPTHSLWRLR